MRTLHIFKAGKRIDASGREWSFSEADLSAAAAAYDPAKHEAPLCVGHPKDNLPAYGWVQGLSATGGDLLATPHQVHADFAELVAAGSFKKLSASFYAPDHPANPVPGVFYLRHVAFLGAQPPAVKGLRPVEFAGADEGLVTVEFDESDLLWRQSWLVRSIGGLFRGLRDWLIEDKGLETADRLLPSSSIDTLTSEAERLDQAAREARPSFTEQSPPPSAAPHQETEPVSTSTTPTAAELEKRAADLAAREATFAEAEKKLRQGRIVSAVDTAIAQGRLPAGFRAEVTAFAETLDAGKLIEFGEGDAKASRTALDQFLSLLGRLPKAVDFSELNLGDLPADDADKIAAFAEAYVTAEAAKGRTVSYADAVHHVSTKGGR